MEKLKISIQKKGKLAEGSSKLLEKIGLGFQRFSRQLYADCKDFNASILFSRDDDIPEYISSGVVDMGIVGLDQIYESDVNVEILRNLNFGKCNLSIAVKKSSKINSLEALKRKVIATSYPIMTEAFFKEKGISVKVIEIKGGVEITPMLGVADAIVDLVSTGFTLKMNGLRVLEKIKDINPVIITNKQLSTVKRDLIEKILFRIDAIENSTARKYLMFNLRKEKLEEIKDLVPGLKSPIISNLQKKGWISVQTVTDESKFWEVINKIKDIGAEGIIILPIEKLIY